MGRIYSDGTMRRALVILCTLVPLLAMPIWAQLGSTGRGRVQAAGNMAWQSFALKNAASDGICYVSASGDDANDCLSWGSAKATPQAAIDTLKSGGGEVLVGCGIFPGPTSIPSFTHVVSMCQSQPGFGRLIGNENGITANWASASNAPPAAHRGTVFAYLTSVTPIQKAYGVEISGIVFDFGGGPNAGGLTILGSIGGVFDLTVQNCGGASPTPCLSIRSNYKSPTDYFNTAENDFRRIMIETVPFGSAPGGTGIFFEGTGGAAQTSVVTNNHFGFISIYNVTTGIQFAGADDSNHFSLVYINVNPHVAGTGSAVAANCGSVVDEDDNGETFDTLATDYNGEPRSGTAVCLGQETGLLVGDFEIGDNWRGNEFRTMGNPVYSIDRSWDIPAASTGGGNIGNGASSIRTGNLSLVAPVMATEGQNQDSPQECLSSNQWSGVGSKASRWCLQAQISPSGVPGFDVLALINEGSQTANLGVSIPRELVIRNGSASSILASTATAPNVRFALPAVDDGGNIVVDNAPQELADKKLTGPDSGNNVDLLNFQGPRPALRGNGSARTLYSYNVPAGTIPRTGCVEVTFFYEHRGQSSVNYRFLVGNSQLYSIRDSSAGLSSEQEMVCNAGSFASQQSYLLYREPADNHAATKSTTIDTSTQGMTLSAWFTAATSDSVTPKGWLVKLVQ